MAAADHSAESLKSRLPKVGITETFRGVAYSRAPRDIEEELERLTEQARAGATPKQLRFMVGALHERENFIAGGVTWDVPMYFYRGRKVLVKPAHVREISYPPYHVVRCGRVNRELQPIFYGSVGDLGPCIAECACSAGENIVIGKWVMRRKRLFASIGFSRKLNISRPNRIFPDYYIADASTENLQRIKDWHSDVFTMEIATGEDWKYWLSTAIAETAFAIPFNEGAVKEFSGQTSIAGIVYPSVATNTFGDNVAIRPDVIDSDFEFERAVFMKVEQIVDKNDFDAHEQVLATAAVTDVTVSDKDGNLTWMPHPKNSPLFSLPLPR